MLLKPLITERSMVRAAAKSYTFVVTPSDTKTDIKKSVEKTFGVNVLSIRTITIHGKPYRSGKRGQTKEASNWKKAIVTIKPDQSIELFDTPKQ